MQTTRFPWGAALLGVPLLIGWIGICAAAFVYVITTISASEQVLQWTTWPLTFVMLGIPLIVALMFGGARLLDQALQMKSFIDELPRFVRDINQLATAMDKAAKSVEAASRSAREAADAADDAAADAATVATGGNANQDLVGRFFTHYESAKTMFRVAMDGLNRWDDFPRYMQSDRDAALAALKQAKLLKDRDIDYVRKAIDLERATRRTRRSNLRVEDVQELDGLRPIA
jgi:hypothetical protein